MYVSRDEGRRWRSLTVQIDVNTVVTGPRRPSRLYAGTERPGRHAGGAFESRGGGKTWKPLGLVGKQVETLAIGPGAQVLYATTDKGAVLRLALPPD